MKRWIFRAAVLAVLLWTLLLPAAAGSLSENFEGYASTDDMSLNYISDGSFVTDLTLSKKGGEGGSQALKAELAVRQSTPKPWGIIRAIYPDDMGSETATGFRLWAKCDQDGVRLRVHRRYTNLSWTYGKEITLSRSGQVYEIPFAEMELTQGTVSHPDRAQDPTLIGEWQFELVNDWSQSDVTVYLDSLGYIEPQQEETTTTASATQTTSGEPQDGTTASSSATASGTETSGSTAASGTETSGRTAGRQTTASGTTVSDGEPSAGLSTGATVALIAVGAAVLVGAGVTVWVLRTRKK